MADEDEKPVATTMEKMAEIKRRRMDELTDSDDILDWVAGFTGDAEFVTAIDEFVEAHAKKFEDMEDGEYTLEHTDLYNKFLAVAEGKLEAFLESKGVTPADFYGRCREAVDGDSKEGDGQSSSRAVFVELLLACAEFTAFAAMMGKAAERTAKARDSLALVAEHLLDFLDDDDNVAKVEEDDLADARAVVEGVSKWVENSPDALMGDYLLKQFELEAQLLPVMYKYMGDSAKGSIRALFALT